MRVTFSALERAGRLGNQLWQVASTVGIARTLGLEPYIPPGWSYRPYLSLPESFYELDGDETREAEDWDGLLHIDRRARMYLQDRGLFIHIADEIRRIFMPSAAALKFINDDPIAHRLTKELPMDCDGNAEAIALHVRRGDTVTQPKGFQPLATLEFYKAALATLPDLPIVVFSDDPGWCRRHLLPVIGEAIVVDHGSGRSHKPTHYARQPATDWLDLRLMTCFAEHVISNSTYAWWAAWLSRNPRPRYPSVWWGPNLAYIDHTLMLPPGWMEIPC